MIPFPTYEDKESKEQDFYGAANGLPFIPIPKCGHTTITQCTRHFRMIPYEEALSAEKVYVVLRNPVSRIRSAYENIWKGLFGEPPLTAWWCRVRERPHLDYHTAPYDYFLDGFKNLELLRLEDIDVWWPVLKRSYPRSFGPLRIRNSTPKEVVLPDEMVAEIEEVYADDLALWRSIG